MSKDFKLGSFLAHPQVKTNHPNAETKKLTNHDTSGTAPAPAPSSGGEFTTATDSTPIAGTN